MEEPPRKKEVFSYNSINRANQVVKDTESGYSTYPTVDGLFILLNGPNSTRNPYGWKMHVSLFEEDENIRKSWNLMVSVLRKYTIQKSKILRRGKKLPEFQKGKEITIYFEESDVNWIGLLQEIERLFLKHGITPNYKPISDKQIPGSHFFSCRCDRTIAGRYLSSLQVETHNVSGKPHAFESLELKLSFKTKIEKPLRTNEEKIKHFYAILERNYSVLLHEFRNKIDRFNRISAFSEIYESDVNEVYGRHPQEIPEKIIEIVRLAKEIEAMLTAHDDKIETMDEQQYRDFFNYMNENVNILKRWIEEANTLILANPESDPHTSEGSVIQYSSDAKHSGSEEKTPHSNAEEGSDPSQESWHSGSEEDSKHSDSSEKSAHSSAEEGSDPSQDTSQTTSEERARSPRRP